MPRRRFLRRFDPQYGVNESMLAVEAKYLEREIENRGVLESSRIEAWLAEGHESCRRCWEEFQQLINPLPERDQRIIRSLLFRDFYHILVLYLHELRAKYPNSSAPSRPLPKPGNKSQIAFDEWLFKP